METLMSLGRTENSKQNEFLMDIRKVGMSIVFGECDPDIFSAVFEEYLDYVSKPSEYLQAIKEIYNKIAMGKCTPDDLLLRMGAFTKTIEYEEPEVEYDCLDIDEDDDDDDIECFEIDEDTAQMLINILEKLSEE